MYISNINDSILNLRLNKLELRVKEDGKHLIYARNSFISGLIIQSIATSIFLINSTSDDNKLKDKKPLLIGISILFVFGTYLELNTIHQIGRAGEKQIKTF